jgi:hypothetical protein
MEIFPERSADEADTCFQNRARAARPGATTLIFGGRAMASYYIRIQRTRTGQGKLTYTGSFIHTCDCWWDAEDEINLGTYTRCSKTFMGTRKNSQGKPREGIYFPDVPGRTGIFIHYWPGPGADLKVWSDGCTVVLEDDMLKIWNDISPLDGHNVTIKVVARNYYGSSRFQEVFYGVGR